MKRYIVSFVELRHYQMTVEARDQQSAIEAAKTSPENPVWVAVALDRYEAQEIAAGAP
ncbi:MAG: hypothetical protein ACREDT_01555 [Methylocella sp.]